METNVLLYVLRRDLRVSDNPILHHLSTKKDHGFTHLLPVYVLPAKQMALSGLLDPDKSDVNPFPDPQSQLGGYHRCGPFRVKFIAEAVWDVKESLEAIGSGLLIRAGNIGDTVRGLVEGLKTKGQNVGAIWMTSHEGSEEQHDEKAVARACEELGAQFQLWVDEKYFVDE
jgi:deoxyribodipyrimidine photo-lyase